MSDTNLSITSAVTGDAIALLDANIQRKLWEKKVTVWDQSGDDWTWAVGSGEENVVWTTTDTAKGAGETVTFTNMAGFRHLAHVGDAPFSTSADWERVILGTYSVTVEEVRNGVRHTDRMEHQLGLAGEIVGKFTEELGKWAGREKSEKQHMSFLEQALGENVIFAGGKSSYNDLRLADGITWNGIVEASAYLSTWVQPAKTGSDREGNPILQYCVFGTTPALLSLKQDPTFQNLCKDSDLRGDGNRNFSGGWLSVEGNFIKEFLPMDHADPGPIGSPINCRAKLGVAITPGTGTFNMKGGGVNSATWYDDAYAGYFRWFPGYPYVFSRAGAITPGDYTGNVPLAGPKYLMVYNWTGSDAGKFGFYSYSAHATQGLTIDGRLGSAASGIRATTLGNVRWNATYNTDAHPVGSLILLCNSSAVPYGWTYLLGRGAGLRAKGQYYNKRVEDPAFDLGKIRGVGTTSVYGQTARKDLGQRRQYLLMAHAIRYAGMKLTAELVTP